ncbi:MAG: phosphoglycerate dehydrogenase [Corynebacterium sp.]|nr:phosphoglycerate dehydrogenase [Corynebacterium sp.]
MATKPVVLIADKLSQATVDALGDDVEVRWVDGPNRPELLAAVPEADAILIRSNTQVDKEVLDAATNLKIVGRAGVGLDNVDIAAATEKGVMVVNAPTSNIHSAAELAFGLMITAARQIADADAELRRGEWNRSKHKGVELYGKTVGIVGLGHIGQLFAERAKAFGMKLIGFDPYANPALAAQLGVEILPTLEEVMEQADFITMHLPKTPETNGMFNKELFAHSKKGQIIVNAARGTLINEDDLYEAISSGQLGGAGIDVWNKEPLESSKLMELNNVVGTQHMGASTVEAQDRAGTDVAASVLKALHGEFVPDAVNVPGGRVSEEVAAWLELARKLGALAAGLLPVATTRVETVARGELSHETPDALGLSALRGVFSGVVNEQVTFVNAMQIASARDVRVNTTTEDKSDTYRSSLTVSVVGAGGEKVEVVGTLANVGGAEKILKINSYHLDMLAKGRNLVLVYPDRPGAIGIVGTLLGAQGINILGAAMTLDGPNALLAVRVDKEIPEAVVEDAAKALSATTARQINLD